MNTCLAYDSVDTCLLLDHANVPEDILVHAYATVIGNYSDPNGNVFVPALGLNLPTFRGLLAVYFSQFTAPMSWLNEQSVPLSDEGALAEFTDLLQLLLDHRAVDDEHHRCVAHLVTTACMGNDHLWQDLGLPDRNALSKLLHNHFPYLAIKNTGEMKWKKFFYKQLCEREEIQVCKAPSCAACADYNKCFGPEI